MAKARVVQTAARDVELSPGMRALVTDHDVVLLGGRDAFRLTLREAQVLAAVVGETDKVDLTRARSG